MLLLCTGLSTLSLGKQTNTVPTQLFDQVIKSEEVPSPVQVTTESSGGSIRISYHINDFSSEPVLIQGKEYTKISLQGESSIDVKGMPTLPHIMRSIVIPDTAKMNIRVIDTKYQEFEGMSIVPSKGTLTRVIDPAEIPYDFDPIYTQDVLFPKNIAELGAPYIIRDFRGQVVTINPFQYNPVLQTLRFYTDITVEVYPDGVDTVNCLIRSELPTTLDSDFQFIYNHHFLNYPSAMGRYTPVSEQGKMLVITYGSFWNAMMPFVQWKNMKGVPTTMVNVSSIGTTAAAIKTYITTYYNTNGLTFVLLVGDVAQIPTFTAAGGASDPTYSYLVGSDHYPDIFVGRFSASTVAQVQTQVERSVEYEKYPQSGADWYRKGTGIASSLGPGDDNEYDYQHIRNIRTDLLNYGYIAVDEFYDGSQGGGDASGNPTTSMISTALNEGRGIINYCGHGSDTAWTTSGFSNTNINALTNDNKLPFIWSVACVNGNFNNYDACFAEAWMRATHNGEPIGAIATFMSSVNQYWDPPMAAQDEFVDILRESYVNNIKNTFGGISFSGCMLMNDQYGQDGYDMTDTWHVFGDPSLQVRTKTPTTMAVTHDTSISPGTTTFAVHVDRVRNALCALSRSNVLLGYGYTNSTGDAIIQLFQPLSGTTNIDLVVTAYNRIPYITSLPVGNMNPNTPDTPTGPIKGIMGVSYVYSTQTTDPEADQVYYLWDWGDGNTSGWIGPYPSGQTVTATHTWSSRGSYPIKVKAKDTNNGESAWSVPLTINIYKLGDVNNDGWVSWHDIDPFVAAMNTLESDYESQHPGWIWIAADCNQDGYVSWRDIDPFVALMNT